MATPRGSSVATPRSSSRSPDASDPRAAALLVALDRLAAPLATGGVAIGAHLHALLQVARAIQSSVGGCQLETQLRLDLTLPGTLDEQRRDRLDGGVRHLAFLGAVGV